MKKRIVLFSSIVALMALLIAGGTMAWFTSNPAPMDNKFTAGTVNIGINENSFVEVTNWVPGQTSTKNVDIDIKSTEQTYVRVSLTPSWSDSLSLDFVEIKFENTENWVDANGNPLPQTMLANDSRLTDFLYYKAIVTKDDVKIDLVDSIKFLGESYLNLNPANEQNKYQGKTFTLNIKAEGVQASYDAYKSTWELDALPTGVEAWTPAQ
jgi:alternate signal-mediated exported protein